MEQVKGEEQMINERIIKSKTHTRLIYITSTIEKQKTKNKFESFIGRVQTDINRFNKLNNNKNLKIYS